MPTADLSAVETVAFPGSNPVFTNNATGLPCIDLLGPTVNVTMTNTGTVAFNAFITPFADGACATGQPAFTSFTLVPSTPLTRQVERDMASSGSMHLNAQNVGPGTYHVHVEWNMPPASCQFGTRLKAGVSPTISIGAAFLTSILEPPGALFLSPLLAATIGQVLDQADLCSSLPPPLPDISASTPRESMQTWLQIVKALAWQVSCECVPGTPTPTPPSPPVVAQPPGWITYPSLPPCLNSDLCGSVADIQRSLQNMQQLLSQHYQFEQLVQRFVLPFAYIRGRRFSTLTATGIQPIERCVGILIEVTQHPATNRTMLGVPEYVFDLGWISVVDADGMIDEIRLTRQATTWLSKLIPTATQVGWGLRTGVTVEITELLAEP